MGHSWPTGILTSRGICCKSCGVVGPELPIVATLDLHANVTRKMVEHADVLVPFHTAPHIDVVETGLRGAAVLRRLLVDGARPVTAYVKLPMVPPAERANTQDPAMQVSRFVRNWRRWKPGRAFWPLD